MRDLFFKHRVTFILVIYLFLPLPVIAAGKLSGIEGDNGYIIKEYIKTVLKRMRSFADIILPCKITEREKSLVPGGCIIEFYPVPETVLKTQGVIFRTQEDGRSPEMQGFLSNSGSDAVKITPRLS